ncbi:flavoprotein [Corynebacterium belfantii]|uniref:flavoprotein n=1 Tax=Corynebacterium belfantii TaxID=2014537 RepID=UPI0018D3497B|nr:flavoprotein [Corynebacterium belfantii]MBG9320520.1 pantothenate metabolism flavoprotein [Corynebacterium belfantii]
MKQSTVNTGLEKPCELPLSNGRLLIIGTGAIGVANLPGWCTAIRSWYSHEVRVLLTQSAQTLVSPQAIAATSGSQPIVTDFCGTHDYTVPHKQLASWPDLVIVSPATLNFISQTALLMPSNLATYTAILTEAPVVVAPSLPGELWYSKRVQAYVTELRERQWEVLEPSIGIAVSDSSTSKGALPNIYEVLQSASQLISKGSKR